MISNSDGENKSFYEMTLVKWTKDHDVKYQQNLYMAIGLGF